VFPSILIIPSVDVDISGVMVTKGIANQNDDDLTVAFSRGAGGAVDGQAAESYILENNGQNTLTAPSREPTFNRLPENGGIKKYFATFETPVLNESNITSLRDIAKQIKKQLPNSPGIESTGPFDIELGFKDGNLWLFQVRPFVENKNAATSEYLNSLNVNFDNNRIINLN
jgi:phosphoenolpyruvate synthase/pyruvate phosphate dikinase